MNRAFAFALPLVLAWTAGAQEAVRATARISFEQVLGAQPRIDFRGTLPAVRWAPDRVHLIVGNEWQEARSGTKVAARPVERAPAAVLEATRAALVGAGLDEGEARILARRGRPAGAEAEWALHGADLWIWRRGGAARRLTTDARAKRIVQCSPTGAYLSFVRDHDLVLVDTAGGEEWAVSTDGSEDLLYGVLDWVYQEEIYGRGNWQGHWWSPSGDAVAFLRLDQSKVKTFVVVDHIVPGKSLDEERHVKPLPMKYPKAGDANPAASLGVALPAERRVQWIDLSRFPDDRLIVHVGFSPKGDRVVFQVQDRIQTWLELCTADPRTGEVTTLLREEAEHGWVNRLEQPHWLADGSFLWLSERTGKRAIEHREADGRLRRALTAAPVVVGDVVRVDEEGTIWFTGHDGRAIDRHLFRVALDGSSGPVRVTREEGTHQTELSADGTLFLDVFSSLASPPSVRLCDADGEVVREFGTAQAPDRERYGYVAPTSFPVKCRDGEELDATLLAPRDLDPARKHPVWVETYSGPDAPSVRNAWSSSVWHQFLVQNGYLVFQVNVRTASGRGQDKTRLCYRRLGLQELADLEDAVAALCANPWADATRVGITGWSYGGTMAALALTHSKAFKLGVAGAGVYDWRLYDTIYTERYMDTPQANPEGYAKNSVIEAAKNLHGHLVLLHGTDDDNVHLQNCMRLV
ncbi:MAG TPA: DPP IV N-terminal domain-containing protein, partial [Planctomycetota bacterium]|nr:DPP IV N-terminal domain-containing protein [Planctomycetota bacterium]